MERNVDTEAVSRDQIMKNMNSTLSSGRKILAMAALILATIVPMGDLVIIPAAEAMFTSFVGVNVGILNFILSGPALIAIFVAPFVGKLMNEIGKKTMLLIGMGFFTVGAVFGIAVENAVYMAVMRGIVGIALGIVPPTSMAIIADLFPDEKKLGTMMGIWNGGMSAVGAAVSFISGLVVTIHWEYVFRIYLVVLPIILLLILFLPQKIPAEAAANGETQAKTVTAEDTSGHEGKMPWKKVWTMYLSYFCGELIICVMYYEIALYIGEAGLGSAALSGVMTTIMTFGTFGACMLFGLLYAKSRPALPGIIHGVIAAAYFLFAFLPSIGTVAAGMIFIGIGNGLIMSYYQTHLAVIVPQNQVPFALGLSSAVLGAAMFSCTYFSTLIRCLSGGSLITVCLVLLIFSICCTVLAAGKGYREYKKMP